MYKEQNNEIIITFTYEEWINFLLLLGNLIDGSNSTEGAVFKKEAVKMLNRINKGNPNWTPYKEDPEDSEDSKKC